MRDADDSVEIKVTDRRSFNRRGERVVPERDPGAEGVRTEPGEPAPPPEPGEGGGAPGFRELVHGFVMGAMVHLGELAEQPGAAPSVNLPAAREMIDMLALLKRKTAGNLDPEEQRFLDGVLAELQLIYAERAKGR